MFGEIRTRIVAKRVAVATRIAMEKASFDGWSFCGDFFFIGL